MSLKELKDAIKQESILKIISHYIQISRKGASYEAICPFHNDSHPSLKINPEKGIFKCFACDTAGDALSFIQFYEKVEFVDALKKAATILGIPLDRYIKPRVKDPKKEMGLRVMRASQELYYQYARSENAKVLKNFLKEREISEETAQTFGLGHAPGRGFLCHFLQTKPQASEKSFTLSTALEIGVIKKSDRGLYDSFNHRVTFPIWDFFGSVVGFGSRAIEPEQKPKYLNSKESSLFNKRFLLYGFHLAKNFIREKNRVIIVEGYMDSISLHQHGFKENVALMGVAISSENARELGRLTPNIYLALDSDPAGMKAMERVNQEFLKIGLIPKFISFSPEKDPDDFLKEQGEKALKERMDTAPAFLDYQLAELRKSIPKSPSIELKRIALENAFHILSPLGTDLAATERIIHFSQNIGLQTNSDLLLSEYQKILSPSVQKKAPPPPEPPPERALSPGIEAPLPLETPVKNLISHLVKYPQLFEEFNLGEVLDFLSHDEVKQYIESSYELYFECDDDEYEKLLRDLVEEGSCPQGIKSLVLGELFQTTPKGVLEKKELQKMSIDLFHGIQEEGLRSQARELKKKLVEAKTQEDHDLILKKIENLDRQRFQLKNEK